MKKLAYTLLFFASFSLVAMEAEEATSHEKTKARYAQQLATFNRYVGKIKTHLSMPSEERQAIHEDKEMAGFLKDAIQKLQKINLEVPSTEIKLKRMVSKGQMRIKQGIKTLVDALLKETNSVYKITEKNTLTQKAEEDMLPMLTELNSLYNALVGALDLMRFDDKEFNENVTPKMEEVKQKLTLIRATIIGE